MDSKHHLNYFTRTMRGKRAFFYLGRLLLPGNREGGRPCSLVKIKRDSFPNLADSFKDALSSRKMLQ
ncbi:MAG: hypothetical protein DRJ11_09075 [Candidatus Aminicenantes bacterium]|nr:MAG: hypothetical protein DRJ11_09075 [Candidatus Aminicenantes bacterium]